MHKPVIAPTATTEVARLTRAMQRCDEDAYREFFRRYFHRLLAYLLVVARGDEAQARELVQLTMIRVARHIRVFEDEAVLWRWLTLLARTAAVDEGRKRSRYFGFLERLWNRRENRHATSVDENAFEELLGERFDQLPVEDRSLLEKKYVDGCSVREIAAELNLSEKAIESRLTRVRAKLKAEVMKGLANE